VLPPEPSSRLLTFLKAFSSQNIHPPHGYYEKFVKKFILTANYEEKIKILNKHGAILSKNDFLKYFKIFSTESVESGEEDDRFNVLCKLMFDLEFYGVTFDNKSKINYLLREDERDSLLPILNHSKYPYTMLDFEEDEVRRRAWQERLYYDLYNGHVVSIELVCEDSADFLENIKILSDFKNLKNVNLLFFHFRDFESVKDSLIMKKSIQILSRGKIYILGNNSPYFSHLLFPKF